MEQKKSTKNFGEKKEQEIGVELFLELHILDHINDSILMYDLEGNIVYANNIACKMLGYKKEELMLMNVDQITLSEPESEKKMRKKILKEKGHLYFEVTHLHKSGKEMKAELNTKIIKHNNKKYVLSVIHDVTNVKNTEKALKESEGHYHDLFENSPTLLIEADFSQVLAPFMKIVQNCSGDIREYFKKHVVRGKDLFGKIRIADCNHITRKTFGVASSSELHKKKLSFIMPATIDAVLETLEKFILKKKKLKGMEIPFCMPDGKEKVFLMYLISVSGCEKTKERVILSLLDITDRKKMEKALEAEHNLLSRTMDSTPNSIVIKDMEGRFLLANKAALELLGISSFDKIMNKTDFDIFPKKEALEYLNEDQSVIKEGRSIFRQRKICDEKFPEKERWYITNKVPLRDQSGKTIGIVTITVDITKMKKMEFQLAKEKNLLSRVVDLIPDYIYVKDKQSRFILANKACLGMLKVSSFEQLEGKTDFDILKDDQAQAKKLFEEEQNIIKTGQPLMGVETEHDYNGEKGWIIENKVPLYDISGEIEGIVGVNINITDSKKAYADLEKSKKNLLNITEILTAAIFVVDNKGVIKFSNVAAKKMFPDCAEKFVCDELKMMKNNIENREIDLFSEGRKIGVGELYIKNILWNGEQTYLLRIRDITERKIMVDELTKKTQQLISKNMELQKLDKMKDEFLSNISHEMRTPLTIIKEFASILSDGLAGKITQQQKECLGTINESVVNLTRIISNILDLSRIEAGRMELNMKVVKIGSVIDEITSYFSSIVDKKGIRLESEVVKNLPPIFADTEKLSQIFNNLIWNAIKFTPEGGLIKVSAKESNVKIEGSRGFIEVSVLDTGEGLAKENLQRIFERFEQVQRMAGARGTGLGLAITKELINMHQGRIWVESEGIGKGCVFKFIIPKL